VVPCEFVPHHLKKLLRLYLGPCEFVLHHLKKLLRLYLGPCEFVLHHLKKLLRLHLLPCEFVLHHLKLPGLHLGRCDVLCQRSRIATGRREIVLHHRPELGLLMHSKGLADVLYQHHHRVLGRREFAERLP